MLSRAVEAVPSRGADGEDRGGHLGSVPRYRDRQPFWEYNIREAEACSTARTFV